MTWFGYVYLSLVGLATAYSIMRIDKERPPITHADACYTLAINCLLFWGLYAVGVR